MTEESGGEEIVYPRKARHLGHPELDHVNHDIPSLTNIQHMHSPSKSPSDTPGTPSFNANPRTFGEVDNLASPGISGPLSTPFNDNEEKIVQKHHGLISGNVPRTPPAKSRIDSAMLAVAGTMKASSRPRKLSDRHARDRSGSSSSSNPGDHLANRKVYAHDVSHLSPSSSTQHLIRQIGSSHPSGTPSGSDHANVSTPNVAQSLLRGTQEGWSCLDDEATAKALRKLDGLTSKTARARASVGSFSRPASLSRPATPPGKDSGQWEGMGPIENAKVVRRSSTNARRLASHKEGDSRDHAHVKDHGLSSKDCSVDDSDVVIGSGSSDDQRAPSVVDKTHGKVAIASAFLSFAPKQGSGSSTTISSQDSPLSVAASSVSVQTSSRHSMGKARRNSGSSDISSIQSSDAASLKDRVALLPLPGDALEDGTVPPVPPLPKDLSTYRSPPASSSTYSFPVLSHDEDKRGTRQNDDGQSAPAEGRRLIRRVSNSTSPLTRSVPRSSSHNANALAPQPNPASMNTTNKTPSKKWSFSTLHIKLSSSPSSSSSKVSSFPLSPRPDSFGPQLRKSASKEQAFSHPSGVPERSWSPAQQDALSSVSSLASLDSKISQRVTTSPTVAAAFNIAALEGGPRSRSRTDSRVSSNQAASALGLQLVPTSPAASAYPTHASRRLTPSSIPFFRRSSSQSIQWPQSSSLPTSSPTLSSAPLVNVSPSRDTSLASAPGSARKKSSVLSLGLPSLLKGSSSRRSLHAEKSDPSQERRDAFLSEEHDQCEGKPERKKDDKDRSESRISVLMGRKRGKVCNYLYAIYPAFTGCRRRFRPPIPGS
jgi:dual specificity tyrosine-phosphorylation-regulated kinase 2/3/4